MPDNSLPTDVIESLKFSVYLTGDNTVKALRAYTDDSHKKWLRSRRNPAGK